MADLFPFDDFAETLATVSRALQTLERRGLIIRYTLDGKPLLFISTWERHQKIDRPNKERYKPPTSTNAVIRETLDQPSRGLRRSVASGTGEQRNRGTEEQGNELPSSPAAPSTVSESDPWLFTEFWKLYPRKVGKEAARKSWARAVRKTNPDEIVAAAGRYGADPNLPDEQFIPHPAKWLNDGRWTDPPLAARADRQPKRATTDVRVGQNMDLARRIEENETRYDYRQIGTA